MPYKKGRVAGWKNRVRSAAWDARYARVARRYHLENSWKALREARAAGIAPALALAMIEKESHGYNVFGHDPTIYVGAGTVTKVKYLAYRKARRGSGNRLMQGVGPLQLTWWETQDRADAMGGCWKPRINLRCGFRSLAALIHAYGVHDGVRRYNGSGPAADAYARDVLAKRDVWHDRLFGK